METEKIQNSILGFIVGDALGVPVEFKDKTSFKTPINDFVEGGRYNVPIGAWSDDSSLVLCLIETIIESGLDYNVYSAKMIDWMFNNYMTPFGKAFGIGRSTFFAIGKLKSGISYLNSGEKTINSNGNGSLMRILPLVFYLYKKEDKFKEVEICSSITHAHYISFIACSIFVEYFHCLIDTNDKLKAYSLMQAKIKSHYKSYDLSEFERILNGEIYYIDGNKLSGLGYVVSTLEVVLYSFINGVSYEDCVLKAINFGNDTDTNAAITGSLAGYYYNEVPNEWKRKIMKFEEINQLIVKFSNLF